VSRLILTAALLLAAPWAILIAAGWIIVGTARAVWDVWRH
jgi:hypothetical protein